MADYRTVEALVKNIRNRTRLKCVHQYCNVFEMHHYLTTMVIEISFNLPNLYHMSFC